MKDKIEIAMHLLHSDKLPKEVVAALLISDGLYAVAAAVRAVANGDNSRPTGLELVAMAISRDGEGSLVSALEDLANVTTEKVDG